MEPVLEVVASVFLLRNPVTNHKHVFILFASVLTQYSRAAILPGFLSSRQEKCFHHGKWERSFHLVGQRTWLHCSPRVLGFNIPDLSAQTREAQGPLHRHTVVGCALLLHMEVVVVVARDTPLPQFKYHIIVNLIYDQRVFSLYQSQTEKTIPRETLTP